MKHLENWKGWAVFGCIIVLGSLIIISVGFQQHAPVIPRVDAQMGGGYSSYGSGFPGNFILSSGSSLFGQFSVGYSAAPYSVATFSSHPSSSLFPGGTIAICGGDRSKTEMTTLMTCSGCGMTMSTCDWSCGATFSFCGTGGGSVGSTSVACTGMICSGGGTGLICGSVNTMAACTTGTICGGNTLLDCSTGMICGGGNTMAACTMGTICGSGVNTMVACTSMGCGGPGGGTGLICGLDTLGVSCTETYMGCIKETSKNCPISPWPGITASVSCIGPTGAGLYCGGGSTALSAYCGGGPTAGAAYCATPLYQGLSVGTNYSLSGTYQRYRAPGHSPAF